MFEKPSSKEYSVWTCKWANDMGKKIIARMFIFEVDVMLKKLICG